MRNSLSHTDSSGNARMVDVGDKPNQLRVAKARGFLRMQPETLELVKENNIKKGDVLKIAEIAGTQAAKQTAVLIPLCHPLALTWIEVTAKITGDGVEVHSECRCNGQTGVEMEALTATSIALLTIYDMCKAVDKSMVIDKIVITEKTKR
jgi:cyclic pyranopterin monophosphate synthase